MSIFYEIKFAKLIIRHPDINKHVSCHVETVVCLSRKKPDDVIRVKLDLDDIDLTAAESKATYEEIKEYILKTDGIKVSSLYIAQVKEKLGLEKRKNYNLPKSEDAKQPKAPKDKEKAIIRALKYFQIV